MLSSMKEVEAVRRKIFFSVLLIVIFGAVCLIVRVNYPTIVNAAAKTQMEDNNQSYTNTALMEIALNYLWVGWIIIPIIIAGVFRENIQKLRKSK